MSAVQEKHVAEGACRKQREQKRRAGWEATIAETEAAGRAALRSVTIGHEQATQAVQAMDNAERLAAGATTTAPACGARLAAAAASSEQQLAEATAVLSRGAAVVEPEPELEPEEEYQREFASAARLEIGPAGMRRYQLPPRQTPKHATSQPAGIPR